MQDHLRSGLGGDKSSVPNSLASVDSNGDEDEKQMQTVQVNT